MNISNKNRTYSNALYNDFTTNRRIYNAFENQANSDVLKSIINEVCKDCSDTPSFRKFKYNLECMNSPIKIISYVSDCYMKGSDLGVIK